MRDASELRMNPNEEVEEPVSPTTSQFGDHVEVLVEDLFIEEYPSPLASSGPNKENDKEKEKHGRLARVVKPLKGRGKSLIYGLLAFGALAVASLVLGERERRASRFSRLFHRLQRSF